MKNLILAFAAMIAAAHPASAQPAPDEAAVAWTSAHAVAVGRDDVPARGPEARAILRAIGDARVVGFGEFTHGAHQPLFQRNRWVRFLVAHAGFTAVTLESSIAQSRQVNDYIAGGPGALAQVVRDGLGWDFGRYAANADLIAWLRAWNQMHPRRTVRLYGADVSGGDARDEMGRAGVAIAEVSRYLALTVPAESATLRTRLAPFAGRFDEHAWHGYSAAERGALRAAAADAVALFARYERRMVAASSPAAFAWGERIAGDLGRIIPILDAWPVGAADMMPGMMKVTALRDRTMADYVLWALRQEGPRGRILSFAHNGHVARTVNWPVSLAARTDRPVIMGQYLAAALGRSYRVVMTASTATVAKTGARGSVDTLLAAARPAPYLIDLRDAPAASWWRRPQTLTHGSLDVSALVPARAADAMLFVGDVSDDPKTAPPRP